MCFRDRIQRQHQENLSYSMLSIIIEKEDFEVNCLYKSIWDSYPSARKKSFLLKKTDPAFSTPFLFIKYSKTTHRKHHIHVIIQNVKKRGIFSIEKNYGAFNRGTLIRFLRNILHLRKKHYLFSQFFHYGFKSYPCPNILIPLTKWTIYASILK